MGNIIYVILVPTVTFDAVIPFLLQPPNKSTDVLFANFMYLFRNHTCSIDDIDNFYYLITYYVNTSRNIEYDPHQ